MIIFLSDTPFTSEDFLNKLFPNFWSFLINFLALIVLFVAIYFIAYKPVKKVIKARKDYVEHNLRDSERAKAINEKKAAEGETIIVEANKKAGEIISKAKVNALASADAIILDAKNEAAARQKAADEAIKQEEIKSRGKIRDEIVNVAIDASKQVLGREVNKDDNAKLVTAFVEDVDDKKGK